MHRIFYKLCPLVFCFLSFAVQAQSNLWESTDSARDALIRRLDSYQLLPTALLAHRPWDRSEWRRLLNEASAQLYARRQNHEDLPQSLDQDLAELRLQIERAPTPLQSWQWESAFTKQTSREVLAANGAGGIREWVRPLSAYRSGQDLQDGLNFLALAELNTEKRLSSESVGSLNFRPRIHMQYLGSQVDRAGIEVESLVAKLQCSNFDFSFGRDQLLYGLAEKGGMGFTNNPMPLDLVKIQNAAPVRLPWFLRALGPSRFSLFAARMEGDRYISHSYLYGFDMDFRPLPTWEFAVFHIINMGGEGLHSRHVYPPETFLELFGLRHGFLDPHRENLSDHKLGVQTRVQIPALARAELYADTLFEDMSWRTFKLNFTQRMAFAAGVLLPSLGSEGGTQLRFEYRRVPPLVFRHTDYLDGYSRYRRALGLDQGPDSDALSLRWEQLWTRTLRSWTAFTYEVHRAHTYLATQNNGASAELIKLIDAPEEKRYRVEAGAQVEVRTGLSVSPSLAFEPIQQYNFTQDRDRFEWLAAVKIEKRL